LIFNFLPLSVGVKAIKNHENGLFGEDTYK